MQCKCGERQPKAHRKFGEDLHIWTGDTIGMQDVASGMRGKLSYHSGMFWYVSYPESKFWWAINTLRTSDANLRFSITTVKDRWRKFAF
jgi:hypothetical protein